MPRGLCEHRGSPRRASSEERAFALLGPRSGRLTSPWGPSCAELLGAASRAAEQPPAPASPLLGALGRLQPFFPRGNVPTLTLFLSPHPRASPADHGLAGIQPGPVSTASPSSRLLPTGRLPCTHFTDETRQRRWVRWPQASGKLEAQPGLEWAPPLPARALSPAGKVDPLVCLTNRLAGPNVAPASGASSSHAAAGPLIPGPRPAAPPCGGGIRLAEPQLLRAAPLGLGLISAVWEPTRACKPQQDTRTEFSPKYLLCFSPRWEPVLTCSLDLTEPKGAGLLVAGQVSGEGLEPRGDA